MTRRRNEEGGGGGEGGEGGKGEGGRGGRGEVGRKRGNIVGEGMERRRERVQKVAERRCWRVLISTTVHTLLLSLGCMVLRSTLKPTGCSSKLHPEVGQPTHDPAHRNSHTNEYTVSLYESTCIF